MGLEAATWISQLVATNPLASDKKSVGDDHFRLIKAVLQATLPNADRPFRFPEIMFKTGNYTIVESDDNKTILGDVSGGSFTLTLPAAPSYDGWQISVIKIIANANPVFISGTIGTPVGTVTKVRVDVPFSETRIIWTGSSYIKMTPTGELPPGTFIPSGHIIPPTGYDKAIGQSLLRADFPELFLTWGTSYGAVDGSHFSAPITHDRFLVGAGSAYSPGDTGGAASVVLSEAQMPAHAHSGNTGTESVVHIHQQATGGPSGTKANEADAGSAGSQYVNPTPANTGGASVPHTHAFTTDTKGASQAHENRPPYLASNFIFRLC